MAILRLLAIVLVSGIAWVGFRAVTPLNPAYANTHLFERHFSVTEGFPYLRGYHLFRPDMRPEERLPLIVVLHGASGRSSFSQAFADPAMQALERAFVLAPDAAFSRQWATPRAPGWEQGDAEELDWAIGLTREVARTHAVDPRRIYIVGASQGGVGVFGALARYPGLFAAGLSYAGAWDAREAGALGRARVWALHGAEDTVIPPRYSTEAIRAIHHLGGEGRLTLLPGVGHGFHRGAEMREAIDWMLAKRGGG